MEDVLAVIIQFRSLKSLKLLSNMAHAVPTSGGRPVRVASPFLSLPKHDLPKAYTCGDFVPKS